MLISISKKKKRFTDEVILGHSAGVQVPWVMLLEKYIISLFIKSLSYINMLHFL